MKRFYSYDDIVDCVRNNDADSIYNYIEYLEGIRRDKTYGLVWEKEKEDFEIQLHDNVPVLIEVSDKNIVCDLDKPTNLLIQGDNLHALNQFSTSLGKRYCSAVSSTSLQKFYLYHFDRIPEYPAGNI